MSADLILRLQTALSDARGKAFREAAGVARNWKSSLQPGNQQRLFGHEDAARDIAAKIEALLDQPAMKEGEGA